MAIKSRTEIKRRAPEDLKTLLDKSSTTSGEAGLTLVREARDYGLSLDDFLRIAIDPKMSATVEKYTDSKGTVDGYTASKIVLNLPVRDDPANAMFLELASDTFATFPGARALFPYVVDEMIQWKYRADQFENTASFVSQSRTISDPELLTTVIDDAGTDYRVFTPVSEGGRVRIKNLKATEKTVRFWKHGMGYEMTYEFARRVRMDLIAPYAARALRELEMSKVGVATTMLINGDGVAAAAAETDQSSLNTASGATATNGTISWKHLLVWLVERAKTGYPVDTLVGNWDAYVQLLFLFSEPRSANVTTQGAMMKAGGFELASLPLINGKVNFALSTTAPANKLIGLSKAEAIEELKEAGSLITESESSIINQTVRYVRTENTGYRIIFPDSRAVFDYGN